MRPLLTLLLACGGEKSDATPDDATPAEEAHYILPAEEVTAPPFDAAAVTAELEWAAARFVTFDARPLIEGYLALLVAGDDGYCPTYGVIDDTVYWADACTAETGTRFDGYGYFVDYDGVSDGNGTTYQGAAIYGVATIEDADGQRIVAAGGVAQVEGDGNGTHVAMLQMDDGFALQGDLAAGTWLADSESPELVLNGAEVEALGVRYLVVRGRLVGEAFDAIIFDDLMGVSGAVEGACTTEPAGAASLLDGEGRWLDILFDGTTLEGTGGDPDRCDGCGGVWFQGLYLGEVCPDLGALTDWSGAPWR